MINMQVIFPLYGSLGRLALLHRTALFVLQIIHIFNTDLCGVRRDISLWPDMEMQATNLTKLQFIFKMKPKLVFIQLYLHIESITDQ